MLFSDELLQKYDIREWRHACAILKYDFPSEWNDIVALLQQFKLCKSWITIPGGSKSQVSQFIDSFLNKRGWVEKQFKTTIHVDEKMIETPTHKVDCFKNGIALEIEWNNKDPFFDRDLNNFRLLFDLRTVSVGIIITRCDELQAIFNHLKRGSSYGNSTTHLSKLIPKIEGGGGAGCPILAIGIRSNLLDEEC